MSAFTRRRLRSLLEAGLPFTVASARSVVTLAPILEGLPISLPVVEFNGAFVTDLRTRRALVCESLAPVLVECVVEAAIAVGVAPFVSTYVEAGESPAGPAGRQRLYPPRGRLNEGMQWYLDSRVAARDARLMPAADPRGASAEPTVCLTLIDRGPRLGVVQASLAERFAGQLQMALYENPYQPGWHWLTLQSARATKARAIERLLLEVGCTWEEVTVFGDEVNDVSMFRAAGRAVAVDNAVAEIKRLAHFVIGANHTDSVVQFLADHWSP